MTIRDFFRTVWQGKYYVLVAVLVVVLGASYYVQRQDTQYRAEATVYLNGVQTAEGHPVTVATTGDDVRSAAVVKAARTVLGERGPGTLPYRVSGELDDEARTVSVRATTADEAWSVEVANAFAAAYVDELVAMQAAQIDELDARKATLAKQLAGVRARLKADDENPLALAEQTIIVDEYTALTIRSNSLRGIAVPGQLVRPATGAEALGLSRTTMLGIGVLAGLVAGVGLAFARRGLDMRVRTAADSARITEAPVLAELFGTRAAEREFARTLTLPVSRKVATPFTESIRELRTAVQVPLTDVEHAVVVITAADPSVPRAFIAANLAASFALSGRRTVAVSGDLRRPQLDAMLPASEGWRGDQSELRPTPVPNLRLLPVSEEEMDPADFLATTRVRSLVRNLRDQAEVVVIDSPPVLAAADATILGGYANGVVLVASAGRTNRAVLAAAVERLRLSNVPLLGVALTGVRGDHRMTYASTYGDDHHPRNANDATAPAPEETRAAARRAHVAAATATDGPDQALSLTPSRRALLEPTWSKVPEGTEPESAPTPASAPVGKAGGMRPLRR